MAAGTRHQAEMQGLNQNDMVALEDPAAVKAQALNREEMRKEFEDLIGCYPLFCLTQNIPLAYWNKIQAHNNTENLILELTSTDPDDATLRNQCKLNYLDYTATKPMPFIGTSIEQCHHFFLTRLSHLTSPSFASYTFLAIDDACLAAEPQELILCTDAADFGEKPGDPPTLKIIRQSVDDIFERDAL
ncbi:MAG: hypothetical protein Q9183_005335, partial [Haloplaca sp. 2 TL-2023]